MAVTRLPLTSSMVEQGFAIKRAALAGMIGAPLFGLIVVGLTVLQYDFMIDLGWHPVLSSPIAWPSGLAVGPYGWLQTLNFIGFGLALIIFARGLHRGIAAGAGSTVGPALLTATGAGMLLAAFTAEPDLTTLPQTVHGWLHLAGFFILSGAVLPSFFVLWRRLRRDPRWRGYDRYTLLSGIAAALGWSGAVALPMAQVAFYLFLIALLTWVVVIATRLRAVADG
jgi:Protein of unknown function (DUF998)